MKLVIAVQSAATHMVCGAPCQALRPKTLRFGQCFVNLSRSTSARKGSGIELDEFGWGSTQPAPLAPREVVCGSGLVLVNLWFGTESERHGQYVRQHRAGGRGTAGCTVLRWAVPSPASALSCSCTPHTHLQTLGQSQCLRYGATKLVFIQAQDLQVGSDHVKVRRRWVSRRQQRGWQVKASTPVSNKVCPPKQRACSKQTMRC